jgi:hypothetical protein
MTSAVCRCIRDGSNRSSGRFQRVLDRGALPDLTMENWVRLLKRISAHSTRIGLNQDLPRIGEIWLPLWCAALKEATYCLQVKSSGGAGGGRPLDGDIRVGGR